MRVIAGEHKGRQFASPKSKRTRPMSDKARGAMFNVLGDVSGLSVLDAFAGTGAIAIEAASRGASNVIAVEKDVKVYRTLQTNIEKLQLLNVQAVRANVSSWMGNNVSLAFDVIVCDPPYDHLQVEVIRRLAGQVRSGGVLVLSWPSSEKLPFLNGVKYVKSHQYAAASLGFYMAR